MLWHRRLGHLSKKRLESLVKSEVLEPLDFSDFETYIDCIKGKMTKSRNLDVVRSTGLLDLIHTDICGPLPTASRGGQRYFISFIDDFSRYAFVFLIHHKFEALEVFKQYKTEVEKELDRRLKLSVLIREVNTMGKLMLMGLITVDFSVSFVNTVIRTVAVPVQEEQQGAAIAADIVASTQTVVVAPVPLRRSSRDKRSTVSSDYEVYLNEVLTTIHFTFFRKNCFQKLDKIKDPNRQSKQLEELTGKMRECKWLDLGTNSISSLILALTTWIKDVSCMLKATTVVTVVRNWRSQTLMKKKTNKITKKSTKHLRKARVAKPLSLSTKSTPSPKPSNSSILPRTLTSRTPSSSIFTSEAATLMPKLTSYSFFKTSRIDDDEGESWWILKVSTKIHAKVATEMQLKMLGDQRRVDSFCLGVWAMKFFTDEDYRNFVSKFQDCLFKNLYRLESTDENKVKVYGKDFIGWLNPEKADDSIWEDAECSSLQSPSVVTPVRPIQDLMEEFEEAATGGGGIQSLALGALDNSFLVSDSGIQVVKNFSHGIHGQGVCVKFDNGNYRGGSCLGRLTPKKALLMRAETNMLLMSPDGTDITMRDITNDSKGAQLDPSDSTFLGLDDNRLCRWDMRDRKGMCFASTGDGSIVVGSIDGKIRLYSKSSMRQAKTAFPGFGSPITHVDVTFDGKWILGMTDAYLILICSLFADKDGKTTTGFSGRMGNRNSAPRSLKLTPLDSHLAGANNMFHGGQFSWVLCMNGVPPGCNGGQVQHDMELPACEEQHPRGYQNQEGLKSCYCYKIVLKDESIVDSCFMHDKFAVSDSPEAPLVVATHMKVSSVSISSRR
ncbi:hypothetical protein HHK36_009928 [Tetracentron sinense]|uniref:Vacuolar import/degradation Vid27 C-terminal domain-containing protein n=1 Tax=Tetracentron sinense TaxID=13715 RepID=A0A835DLS7_TETSI|nr:hypothetical protein HHK36_009928 [Tetracentron sinense]